MALFWLSNEAWTAIEPHLPKNQPGARRVDESPEFRQGNPKSQFCQASARCISGMTSILENRTCLFRSVERSGNQ